MVGIDAHWETSIHKETYTPHHARTLMNIWNHGPALLIAGGCQLLLSVVITLSG